MITLDAQSRAEMAHAQDVAADYVPGPRHNPTPEQIAVRDAYAEIGNLDTYDATRFVMAGLALIDQRIAAGVTAEQIAIDMTLTRLVGLTLEESEFVQKRAKANGVSVREAARKFSYIMDYDALRAEMDAA